MKLKGFKKEKCSDNGFRLTSYKREFLTDSSADSYMVRNISMYTYEINTPIREHNAEAELKLADCSRMIHLSFSFDKEGEKKINNFVDKLIEFRENYHLAKAAVAEYNKKCEGESSD